MSDEIMQCAKEVLEKIIWETFLIMLNTHSSTKSLNFKGVEAPNEVFENDFSALPKHRRKSLTAPTHLWNYRFMFLSSNLKIPFQSCRMNQAGSMQQNVISAYWRLKECLKETSFDVSVCFRPGPIRSRTGIWTNPSQILDFGVRWNKPSLTEQAQEY